MPPLKNKLDLLNQVSDGAQLGRLLVVDSFRMQELYRTLARAAATDCTVLLLGETGTGKELAARYIHENGMRAGRPFVAVNCAAMPESLLESEMFGHERGAFTGAVGLKRGKIELAEGGTLFLDELGDLLLPLQAKLLRVLQERVIERIGSTRPVPLNVRLIAATNRNLRQMIAEGQFREDLYYRLNVVKIRMPPLRERMEDLPALAMFFVDKCATRAGRRLRGLSPEAIEVLRAYHWPGNIRELENTIVSAVALGEDEWIQPHDLPEEVREKTRRLPASEVDSKAESLPNYRLCVREARQQLILSAFEESGYDHQEAAQRLKMHPNNLHRVVKSLGLKDMLRQRRAVCICGSQRFEVGP